MINHTSNVSAEPCHFQCLTALQSEFPNFTFCLELCNQSCLSENRSS